jgi:hypothetical protein
MEQVLVSVEALGAFHGSQAPLGVFRQAEAVLVGGADGIHVHHAGVVLADVHQDESESPADDGVDVRG